MFSVALFLCGCSSLLVKDEAPPPIENGSNRVESILCNHHSVGTNVCWVEPGTKPADVRFEVYTYLSGRLTLRSNGGDCSINEVINYKGTGFQKIDLAKYVQKFTGTCIIDMVMNVDFPGQKNTDVVIRGMMGRAVIMYSKWDRADMRGDRVILPREDEDFYQGVGLLSFRQQRQYLTIEDRINIGTRGSRKGKIRIDGCGLQTLMFEYESELVPLKISTLVRHKINEVDSCVFYGRVIRVDMPDDVVFAVALEVYSKDLIEMPEPQFYLRHDELRFETSAPVSWTFVDDQAINNWKGKTTVNDPVDFKIRQLTAIGRTRVIKVEGGTVAWSK